MQAQRSQDVALLAVQVVQQRDEGRTVGVVLDTGHLGRHFQLVALEVNQPVLLLFTAALMTDADLALIVPARVLFLGLQE